MFFVVWLLRTLFAMAWMMAPVLSPGSFFDGFVNNDKQRPIVLLRREEKRGDRGSKAEEHISCQALAPSSFAHTSV
jgi:hypothetical protein